MTKLREASSLTEEERERIAAAYGLMDHYRFIDAISWLLGITPDTVRQVLREEGE